MSISTFENGTPDARTHAAVPAAFHALTDATIEVFEDASAVLPVWQELLAVAEVSPYQTPDFILPWLATLAPKAGIRPAFILKRSVSGSPLALFCLGVEKRGPLKILRFLGGKDSNFNLGLIHRDYAPDATELRALFLAAASRKGPAQADLLLLLNQPKHWLTKENCLAQLIHQPSPSFAYGTALPGDAEALFQAKISKDSRKKLRKKEQKLSEGSALTYLCDPGDIKLRMRIITAFFVQKRARFEAQGIKSAFEDEEMLDFVNLMAQRPGPDHLELHALLCGERIVATYGGAMHNNHFSAFFNSFDADPQIARSSPGDLLLLKIVAEKCAAGITSFDLGIGEARYKRLLCEVIPLFDTVLPLSWKGRPVALALALMQKTKRAVKQNQRLFNAVKKVRALLRAKSKDEPKPEE